MFRNQLRAGSGFTLIELLVVIGVIASILVYVIPVAYGSVRKSRLTIIAMNMRNVTKAVEDYIYTEGSEMLQASESNLEWLDTDFLVDKEYLPSKPKNVEIEWKDPDISDGTATVKVVYTKDDVDIDKLREIWAEIEEDSGKAVVYRKLAKYW